MGGFSLGLLIAGLVAPFVGRSIDRYGGHVVMAAGALVSALGLFGLAHARSAAVYLAVWMVLGVAMTVLNLVLNVVLVLTSVVSAGYYLPVVMAMYMKPGRVESEAAAGGRFGRYAALAVAASVGAVILFGLWPAPAIDGVLRSGGTLVEAPAPIDAQE